MYMKGWVFNDCAKLNEAHGVLCVQHCVINLEVWDEINNPFPNFNGATIAVWKWIGTFTTLYLAHGYLCMLGLQ